MQLRCVLGQPTLTDLDVAEMPVEQSEGVLAASTDLGFQVLGLPWSWLSRLLSS